MKGRQGPGTGAVQRLVRQARTRLELTLDDLSAQSGVDRRTIINIEQGNSAGSATTRRRLERALRMTEHVLDDVEQGPNPEAITLDQIMDAHPVVALSDAELIWELTNRLQARNTEIEQLRARIAELES
ncbi:helix-turn-helix domain-containing protein [Citricoccus sp. NR2]|uniref:helix-turn-helix domain-containing protein n=1 Tax=Citricoccus sp. NR2 TaxID=3004095 RepID=UPI0022DD7876|nr:helix-turn-helix domain-containing protein [Citricoccus sp. NR2]WBL18470.1 hypothetical protein O1A05_11980 [Citricoccus sp. NR2]